MTNVLIYISLMIIYIPGVLFLLHKKIFLIFPLPSVYFLSLFVFNVLGSLVVIFPSMNIYGFQDLFSIEYYLILVLQCIFFYLMLFLFCNNRNRRYNSLIKRANGIKLYLLFYILWFFSIISIILFLFFGGNLPIFNISELLSLSNRGIVELRSAAVRSVPRFHWFRIGFYNLPQLATLLSFLIYKRKKTCFNKVMFYISFIMASFLSISFLYKDKLAVFLVMIVFTLIIYDKKIYYKRIISSIVVGIITILFFYFLYFSETEINYYFNFVIPSLINRIVGVYSIGLAAVIEVVEHQGFFLGTTFINPMGIFPYESVTLGRVVHLFLFGRTGNATVPAIGEAYANFGWLGIFLFLFLINYSLFFLNFLVNNLFDKDSILWALFIVFLAFEVYKLSMTSLFIGVLSPVNLLIFAFLIFLVIFISSSNFRNNF
ncbi:oligosaccharide repeat unit polymerase [Natroniella acetigena]|uniref:O-antigen polymerase n=1 Tax=Natroniella acetigena TaxID=52004 RepID=UPI00200AF2D0|nr:O-antigen polymerase [Natroniella acetigena]MCK8827686.1 oligosaccharide repeat unit polymerase [Natroniella acetigena]